MAAFVRLIQTLLGEIAHAKRPVGRPLLRFKDCIKRDLISFDIDFSHWEDLAVERDQWRKITADGLTKHDKDWLMVLAEKRLQRHTRVTNSAPLSDNISWICQRCGRCCGSRVGLFSHQRRCFSQPDAT
ncbi:hypothetical protein ACJJTC_009618 [Scirpophaga incertulas]